MVRKFGVLLLFLALVAPSAFAAPIVGGTTTIAFNDTFLGLGLGVAPIAPGDFVSPFAQFPITGGDTTIAVFHAGGLSLTDGISTLAMGDFVIDLTTLGITGNVVLLPANIVVPNAPLFSVGPGFSILLSDDVANVLNTLFGTDLGGGLEIGTAVVDPIVRDPGTVPEPSTWALMGAGLSGLILLRRRKA